MTSHNLTNILASLGWTKEECHWYFTMKHPTQDLYYKHYGFGIGRTKGGRFKKRLIKLNLNSQKIRYDGENGLIVVEDILAIKVD